MKKEEIIEVIEILEEQERYYIDGIESENRKDILKDIMQDLQKVQKVLKYMRKELHSELSGGEEKCPICGGKLHEVCYKCTKELCSPFRGEERSTEEMLNKYAKEHPRKYESFVALIENESAVDVYDIVVKIISQFQQEDNPIMSAKDILIKKEILYIHNGELKFNEDILFRGYVRILIEAMHDFASQSQQKAQQEDKISDEDIEKWIDKGMDELLNKFKGMTGSWSADEMMSILKDVALISIKAVRDGQIKTN